MADQVQWRGGSRQNSDQFTGAPREVTVDTSDWILRVHDGMTPGGHKMMKVNDCLKVETADKCNPNVPSCKVTVNGQFDINGDVDLDGNMDMEGNLNLDGNLTVLDKHDTLLTGNLTVEGKTHVTDLNVTGCITNEANPCGLNEPVTVCDDFKVVGDTNLHNTVIDGNLIVHGDLVQDGITIAVKTNEVILTHPGPINQRNAQREAEGMASLCDILPPSGNMRFQEDANIYIEQCLLALETAICAFDITAIDEIQDIKDDLQKIWIAIAALENRLDVVEADIAAIKARLDLVEKAIGILETEIEVLGVQVHENAQAIEALKVLVAGLQDQIDILAASIGDGRITLEDSNGVDIGNFTVNQKGDTTITLPVAFSGDYNDLNNKPVIGDGELKIQDTDGVLLTTFTANQIDDDVLTLPKGFSGDYNDLVNKPEINDGSMTLESESGTVYGSFSANEASNITISIPDPFSGDWADINNKPTEFPSASHTHTLEELTDTSINGESDGQVLTYDSAQKLWVNSDVPESGLPESDINNLIGQQKLDDHVDVTVPNPKQHDILAWDDRLQLWVAKSPLQPPSAISVKGVINVSQPAPQNPKAGDLYFHHDPNVSTGPDDVVLADPTWTGIVGQEVHEGEYVLYSTDNEWHHTGNDMVQLNELQSDWDQVDPNEPDYIHNKPDIIQLIDDNAGDGQINVNPGPGLSATGNNATANQKGNTTRTLSVKAAGGITIDGSGNVIIDPNFNLDGNITLPGDGAINVNAGSGLTATGSNATANQTGPTTRTLSAKVDSGLVIDANGSITIDPNFNLDVNVTPPGDGAINFNAGAGLASTGNNATANQTTGTTKTFTVKTGGGIVIDANGGVSIDPSFNLDGNVTAPNNGLLTVLDHAGATVETFTANQAGPSTVILPKGFSGDYNDLGNKPAINNGKLTIKNNDGSTAAEFTANQAGDGSVTLPKGFSGAYGDLSGIPSEFPPASHTHNYLPTDINQYQLLSA